MKATKAWERRRAAIQPTDKLRSDIEAWVDETKDLAPPPGPSVDQCLHRAWLLLDQLERQPIESIAAELEGDDDFADVLYATCSLLSSTGTFRSDRPRELLSRLFDIASTIHWDDGFGERAEILSRVAFLGWNECRRLEDYPGIRAWQSRCCEFTLGRETVRYFFSIPLERRSAELTSRFLGDETVLLTYCVSLDDERNRSPEGIKGHVDALYRWLLQEGLESGLDPGVRSYLLAKVAITGMVVEHHLGRDERWQCWVAEANRWALEGKHAILAAAIQQGHLVRRFDRREYDQVILEAPSVIARLDGLSMVEPARWARLTMAAALKDAGRAEEAYRPLTEVLELALSAGDFMTASLSLANRSEVLDKSGRADEALRDAKEALVLAQKSSCGWAIAVAKAFIGEWYVDHGDVSTGIDAYRAAARTYESLGMVTRAAYMRILLADALLVAGQPTNAVSEVVAALPAIEAQRLSQEAVAAVMIVREALYRREVNSDSLRILGNQLALMKESGSL